MSKRKKKLIAYIEPAAFEALQQKAVQTRRSLSDLINAAVEEALAEDAEDFAVFEERVSEPLMKYETLVEELKTSNRI